MTQMTWRNGNRLLLKNPAQVSLPAPAIVLIDPKYPHNVGQIIRAASCYHIPYVVYTGQRISKMEDLRIPREERMRDYEEVNLINYDRPFDILKGTPVGVEIQEDAELLTEFLHPKDAIYVFGPEDGGLGRPTLQHCHRFLKIPTRHCLNLAMAVGTVLYDRYVDLRHARD